MANYTVRTIDVFPDSTSVSAYLPSQWPPDAGRVGAPHGSAVATATTSAGLATFTGVSFATEYVAYAVVNSVPRYLGFRVRDADPTAGRLHAGGFIPFTAYSAGDLIVQNSITYYANVDFTSGAAFDPADWSQLPVSAIDPSTLGQPLGPAKLGADGKVLAAQLPTGSVVAGMQTFSVAGDLAVATGNHRLVMPTAGTIASIEAAAGTAPDTTGVIVDVNKNGTTVFTTQANRPTVAPAGHASGKKTPDVTAFAVGDYFTVDVDQIGTQPPAVTPTFISSTVDTTVGSTTSFVTSPPAGLSVGDLWLLSIFTTANVTDLITPSGLTALESAVGASGQGRLYRYWRLITGTETSYTFTSTGGSTLTNILGAHIIYRGCPSVSPIDVSAMSFLAAQTGGSVSANPPALTTTTTNTVIVYAVTLNASRAASGPSGYAVRGGFSGLAGATARRHVADIGQATADVVALTPILVNCTSSTSIWISRTALKGTAAPGTWNKGSDLSVMMRYTES